MSQAHFSLKKVFILLLLSGLAFPVLAEEPTAEELKKRATNEHYAEELKKQNEKTATPASASVPTTQPKSETI